MVSGPFFPGDDVQYIYHLGPGQMFLSKLPEGLESLNEYDAKGDFFKIGYAGPISNNTWALNDHLAMNVTIPKTTPPGKYVMRIEQWLPHGEKGQSQWFVNCAHVEIVGAGGGTPGPFVRFPGAYSEEEQAVWFRNEDPEKEGYFRSALEYVMPEPDVWTG